MLRTFPNAAFVVVVLAKEKILIPRLLRNDNKDQVSIINHLSPPSPVLLYGGIRRSR